MKREKNSRRQREKSQATSQPKSWQCLLKQYWQWAIIWEIPRKSVHASIGILTLHLYVRHLETSAVTPYLIAALVPAAGCDIIRFAVPEFNRIYVAVLGPLMRESEINGWNGVIFYLIGAWTVLIIFPKDIAVISILVLAWSDTAASTFGRLYGGRGPLLRHGKSLIGSIAACCMAMFSVYLFWGYIARFDEPGLSWHPSSRLNIHSLALVTGIIGAFAEQFNLCGLNDNCVIPILTGSLLYLFLKGIQHYT
ncbi:hypothetical protein PORY_002522 [Pneumocystis oryctolagi]|uniref:Uncharacterized protein n=1 Tax=Pneumocystis oryctolagi TaxID=42067 RepID=A0ACB7CB59_9ASCO|nr:hypothetical protein PORY_002522 [Pneumocystis oryctolagi]